MLCLQKKKEKICITPKKKCVMGKEGFELGQWVIFIKKVKRKKEGVRQTQ